LEQLLGVPFLHVVHYPEVVNNIGFCFARGSAEFRLLEGVFVQLSSRIEAVKDAKWAAETAAKTERMLSSIDGLESVGLLLPTRRFLIDGEILSVSRGRARKLSFFVFNDLVLYCKDFSGRLLFSGMFEMDAFSLDDEGGAKNALSPHSLKMIAVCAGKKKKKTWCLCFDSAREKEIWLATLREARERYRLPKGNTDSALLTALLDANTLQIGAVVGEGAAGIVYKGVYCGERLVAVKKIKNVTALSQSEKDAFVSEVQILKTFQCPQIIEFIGCVVSPDNLWSVTEFISLGTLKAFLSSGVPIALQFKVLCMLDIARGIDYLHKHSIMHRDIKSDNVLVDNTSSTSVTRLKLTDFGASRMVKDKTERNYTRIGTPIYVSPEVLKGESYSFSTDVFSFAILMWEIMSQTVSCFLLLFILLGTIPKLARFACNITLRVEWETSSHPRSNAKRDQLPHEEVLGEQPSQQTRFH
jgi:tRNA A-37 threonylcarbamoyl transferase component Bud32